MKMGVMVWVFFAILTATLLNTCSLALTQDGITLLEIKITLNDSKNFLSNWKDSDESPCKWTGISCHPHDQRVRSINLPYMQLGGYISPSIGQLSRLQRLAFHQNSLHGFIPNEITNCTELRALYLRSNFLQGGIPSDIGNLSLLTILDLSSNTLKGAIPSSLGRLTHLHFLNLSTNFFSGEIPDVGVLSTFGNKSFIGNLDLCGQQVHKQCRTSLGFPAVLPHAESDEAAVPTKRSSHYIKGVLIGAMSTMGLALIILPYFPLDLVAIKEGKGCEEIHRSQETSSSRNKYQADHFPWRSSIYFMIDRSREGSDQVFERELEILGSIKHINLVNLRGYCRLPASKLLIYDFLAKGSLDDFLHEHGEEQSLNWNARLRDSPWMLMSQLSLLALLAIWHQSTYRRPTDPSFVKRGLNVVGWMNTLLRENRLEDVVDKRCTGADVETVEAILEIAARCTDADPDERPSMQQVLQLLGARGHVTMPE
ncbi:hypothetical protein F0562_023482 [Nyssa sinensis]|uniref:Tyrosine-protein kinase catalytic domain-containing protein n=1 Tax=Nyssa sinensis TaxID=561372 RepID=A0A5J5BL02_9ASTE|nr:hypothetical protein F0562_023482 [Nyssa sinensis]